MRINADFDQHVAIDTNTMDWVPSPMKGVDRRMLDRIGDEVARATSLVRYAPESYFSPHTHGGGEEFLVLDGTFVDEHGAYPAGTYVRNPVGSSHTPSSPDGCTIFVKLWQMDPADQTFVRTHLDDLPWISSVPGAERASAHKFGDEEVFFLRLQPGYQGYLQDHPGGEETYVISGSFSDENGHFPAGSWIRQPVGSAHTVVSEEGCLMWLKAGHLLSVEDMIQSLPA